MNVLSAKEWLTAGSDLISGMRSGASHQSPIVVMIDADGTPHRAADPIMHYAAELGTVRHLHVYGNFSRSLAAQWAAAVRRYRARAHMCFSTATGKNATDIRMTVDAMDLLHSGQRFTFILCCSDSDMTPLAARIREAGASVYGVGATHTPHSFRDACTTFSSIQLLLDRSVANDPTNSASSKVSRPPTYVQDLVISMVLRLGGNTQWVSMTDLGPALRERDPTFHSRSFKRRTLIDLVASVELLEVDTDSSPARVRVSPAMRNG
jgi:hypothetical protein